MAVKYNAALRGTAHGAPADARQRFEALNVGNGYTTTIRVLHAAINALSRLSVVCPLYRGVSSSRLPTLLRVPNEYGCRVAADLGFGSATARASLAHEHAEATDTLVLELVPSMCCRGAALSWLSQFPAEDEYAFAPGTWLEVQRMRVEGSVTICEVRPTDAAHI
jgi:hypothetical protein